MHWELSEEQELFADSLRDWLRERASPETVRNWLDNSDFTGFEQAFNDEGWSAVGFDEATGGQGGGLLELALTSRELGRTAAPSSAWLQNAIVVPALAEEPELQRAAIESGAITAWATRSDRIPAPTSVRLNTERLSGEIPLILGAVRAKRFLVPVLEGDEHSLWLVDADADGVRINPRPLLDRSRDVADVSFHNASARRLDVDAAATVREIANRAAVLVSADALGAAERMLELTVEYSRQRKQFGQPIGAFQAVKHAAAQMLVTVESSMSVVYYSAESTEEQHPERATHAAVAKAQVTESAAGLADTALTLHGAIGYTWEHDLQLFYKRAKLDRALFGTPAAWNERIASTLQLLPASV